MCVGKTTNMKPKFLTVILVSAALFAGLVLWRVDHYVSGNRMEWAEAQARNQTSSLVQAINAEIKSGRRMLSTVTNDSFRPEAANWKALQPYYTLALMTTQGGTMSITRMLSKADSPAASWNAQMLTQYLGYIGKELESPSAVILRAFKDPQKHHHVALIFAGGGTAYILVGSGENFQGLIDAQKGSMSSFSIIAGDGLTISHPIPDYIGNIMSDSTLLKEIRKTGAAQGVGTFLQGRKSIFGMYEKVPGTNAYVISTVPLDDLLRNRFSLAWLVCLALGFSLLGLALYFWYERQAHAVAVPSAYPLTPPVSASPAAAVAAPMARSAALVPATATAPVPTVLAAPSAKKPAGSTPAISENTQTAVLSAPTKPVPSLPPSKAPPSGPPPSGAHPASVVVSNQTLVAPLAPRSFNAGLAIPEEPPQDKADAYRQVASALGQEMRAPIASIVGFSQMVLSKTQDPEVVQAVESILREARSSRDVLEKLYTFSGERTSAKTDTKIENAIAQALKKFETAFRDKGVTVEKDFKDTTPWPIATEELVTVFDNLFSNAVEAMERMQDKRLKISVREDSQGLHVVVSDSGEGIAIENLQKIFDPFFTTRSFTHHVGLGLPVVFGILKEHHADIQIKSTRSEGTQVQITFSPEAKTAARPVVMKTPVPEPTREAGPVIVSSAPAPTSRLTEVNVDRLLDISNDDAPLEFLDGQGFSDVSETIGRASPVPVPVKPSMPPPPITRDDEDTDPFYKPPPKIEAEVPEEFVAGPKPSLPNRAPAILPDEEMAVSEPEPELIPDVALDLAAPVEIDKPKPRAAKTNSSLDSYKVEIRRPGKRT